MASGTKTLSGYGAAPANDILDLGQLVTAAEYTSSILLRNPSNRKDFYKSVFFQIVLAGITTNVVVRLQGSLDGANWFNLEHDDKDYTYTADGTEALFYKGDGETIFVRLLFVSEDGGTAATIDVTAKVM